jgi:hypothetical protein
VTKNAKIKKILKKVERAIFRQLLYINEYWLIWLHNLLILRKAFLKMLLDSMNE